MYCGCCGTLPEDVQLLRCMGFQPAATQQGVWNSVSAPGTAARSWPLRPPPAAAPRPRALPASCLRRIQQRPPPRLPPRLPPCRCIGRTHLLGVCGMHGVACPAYTPAETPVLPGTHFSPICDSVHASESLEACHAAALLLWATSTNCCHRRRCCCRRFLNYMTRSRCASALPHLASASDSCRSAAATSCASAFLSSARCVSASAASAASAAVLAASEAAAGAERS